MPFVDWSTATGARGGAADALAHDVITRLAKLRSMFVIAQGTVFALHERRIGPEEAGRMLNVDYVVSGSVRRVRQAHHRDGRAGRDADRPDRLGGDLQPRSDDVFLVLDEIGNRIVASVATRSRRSSATAPS